MKYLKYFKKEKMMAGLACRDFMEAPEGQYGTLAPAAERGSHAAGVVG